MSKFSNEKLKKNIVTPNDTMELGSYIHVGDLDRSSNFLLFIFLFSQ